MAEDRTAATTAATQLELTLAISKAQRKLNGAWYDLTRPDRHPNDRHKALAKVDEAVSLLASIPRGIEGS